MRCYFNTLNKSFRTSLIFIFIDNILIVNAINYPYEYLSSIFSYSQSKYNSYSQSKYNSYFKVAFTMRINKF